MKSNNTDGYYFFVYSFNPENFQDSTVFDAHETGEVISENAQKGTFEYAFYVKKKNISNDSLEAVAETATKDEAVSAYFDWQKEDIYAIEEELERAAW